MKPAPKKPKYKKLILLVAGAALLVAMVIVFTSKDSEELQVIESYTIEQGLTQSTLTLSGRVEANSSRNLSFPVAGRIASMTVDTGDTVTNGQTISRLDTSLLSAQKREAEAELSIQEAILQNLLAGNRPEEIAVKEESVTLAELAYDHLLSSAKTLLYDTYTTADNAIRNVIDDYILNAQSANPRLDFVLSRNQSLGASLERDRVSIEATLADWEILLASGAPEVSTQDALAEAESHLVIVRDFMNLAALAVNSADTTNETPDALLRTWKTSTAAARTEIVAALSEIQTARRDIETQNAKVNQAKTDLALAKSGATPTDINTQQQNIARSEARIQTINAEIGERTLRSPIDGVVADVIQEAGETVAAGAAIVTIISAGQPVLNLETPELVLPQLRVGNRAELTFLALSPHAPTFGTITTIDPQATIDNGLVPYYNVEVTLDETDLAITPGLLADAMVMVNDFPDSIAVPRRFLLDYNPAKAEASVWLRTPAGLRRQDIMVGQTLSDQRVIVTGGLKTDDIIVRVEPSS